MRKKFLEKKLRRLEEKKSSLIARAQASQDAAEVRSINDQLSELAEEISEIREEISILEAEEKRSEQTAGEVETRSATVPSTAQLINPLKTEHFVMSQERSESATEKMEYRKAFMAYIQKGTPIPAELRVENPIPVEVRAGNAINSEDTAAAIPMTIMNEVINTVRKRYGNLYSKVRKMNVPGGVKIPIGSLQATFKWITESTVSPRQKTDALGSITFGYNVAEIRIAQTFLSSVLTLSAFESEIAKVIAVAYLQAMDEAIVKGSGDGAPLGILNDARITRTVKLTAAQISDWTEWRKKFFASLPLGYRSGEFIFPVSTCDAYLETMADGNNNPIFKQATGLEVNDGDERNPNGRFFGREISLVEPDIIADFDTANTNDVIGIYWQPDQYAMNENFGFTARRYYDDNTNEWVDKVLVVTDGKVLNPNGFVKILKG